MTVTFFISFIPYESINSNEYNMFSMTVIYDDNESETEEDEELYCEDLPQPHCLSGVQTEKIENDTVKNDLQETLQVESDVYEEYDFMPEKQQAHEAYHYNRKSETAYDIPPAPSSFDAVNNSNQSKLEYDLHEINAPPVPPRKWQLASTQLGDKTLPASCRGIFKRLSSILDDRESINQSETMDEFDDDMCKFVNPSDNVTLMGETEKLKKVHHVLTVQNSLLKQKCSMFTDINKDMKDRREILEKIALKEKENHALLAGPVASDNLESNEEANEFYPTSRTNWGAEDTHTDTFVPIKQTFDYRDPILTEEIYFPGLESHFSLDPSSFVTIYDVNFDNRNKIVAMFDKDSGIGMN
ncbi:uncharacterized protein LOC132755110 [Ruditapes philippinarum]|uniref:uncharacterized protein LOC132755110 n=1 Tax=Ruditapes philippinarum TaxID=129788 RepID=UPI00295B602F|nr:uncharacterized protein LOC132755110 [Ruditapes philippinarum]